MHMELFRDTYWSSIGDIVVSQQPNIVIKLLVIDIYISKYHLKLKFGVDHMTMSNKLSNMLLVLMRLDMIICNKDIFLLKMGYCFIKLGVYFEEFYFLFVILCCFYNNRKFMLFKKKNYYYFFVVNFSLFQILLL